jgi:hypothetical protein
MRANTMVQFGMLNGLRNQFNYLKPIRLALILLFSLSSLSGAYAQTRIKSYQKSGTATTASAVITGNLTFNPSSFCIYNDSTTVDLWVDITDGVAVAADDSTNVKIPATSVGSSLCIDSLDTSISEIPSIAVITSSSTAAYRFVAFRSR